MAIAMSIPSIGNALYVEDVESGGKVHEKLTTASHLQVNRPEKPTYDPSDSPLMNRPSSHDH